MADDFAAVADLVANTLDISSAEVTDLLEEAPLVRRLPVIPSSNGEQHKYVKLTQNPVTGFRAENAGRAFDHSVDTLVTIDLKIIDFSWGVDKAVADSWMKGPQDYIAREGLRHLRSALFKIEKQVLNGTVSPGDSDGFSGFASDAALNAPADAMVTDDGGTGSDVMSVYLCRVGSDDVSLVMRGDTPIQLGETIVQDWNVASNQHLPMYYTPATAWVGLQLGSAQSVARLANIEAATTTLDDDKMYDLIKLFPSERQPNLFVMNRTALASIRKNRTATSPSGAPAARPTDIDGIEIIVTDGLSETEAAIS